MHEHSSITLDQAKEISNLNKFKTEHLLSDLILLEVVEQELTETDEVYRLYPTSENAPDSSVHA